MTGRWDPVVTSDIERMNWVQAAMTECLAYLLGEIDEGEGKGWWYVVPEISGAHTAVAVLRSVGMRYDEAADAGDSSREVADLCHVGFVAVQNMVAIIDEMMAALVGACLASMEAHGIPPEHQMEAWRNTMLMFASTYGNKEGV